MSSPAAAPVAFPAVATLQASSSIVVSSNNAEDVEIYYEVHAIHSRSKAAAAQDGLQGCAERCCHTSAVHNGLDVTVLNCFMHTGNLSGRSRCLSAC